jgi:Mg2+/citrate symporter
MAHVGRGAIDQGMGHNVAVIVGLIVMVALIVGVDVAFLRDHFILRLIANVGIVLVFAVLYFSLRNHI